MSDDALQMSPCQCDDWAARLALSLTLCFLILSSCSSYVSEAWRDLSNPLLHCFSFFLVEINGIHFSLIEMNSVSRSNTCAVNGPTYIHNNNNICKRNRPNGQFTIIAKFNYDVIGGKVRHLLESTSLGTFHQPKSIRPL